MIAPADLEACNAAIRHGSLSFHAASRLLPKRVRDPALALYAFCRLADDAVDLHQQKADAVLRLRDRLDRAYDGRPENAAADRAFCAVIEEFDMPRALPEALLEGLAWDAMGHRYATLSELHGYSARVAAAVGAMMTVLMGVRDGHALARACDLGLAMQLTNIARDVGEDAAEGRLYLPLDWLTEAGVAPEAFLADPHRHRALAARLVKRLLAEANRLYYRAEAGIPALPRDCRSGIYAARYIYAGIGGSIRRQGYDTLTRRARTGRGQKLGWLALSGGHTTLSAFTPRSAVLFAPPMPEVRFLVAAAADAQTTWVRQDPLFAALAQLAKKDRSDRAALMGDGLRSN